MHWTLVLWQVVSGNVEEVIPEESKWISWASTKRGICYNWTMIQLLCNAMKTKLNILGK